MHALLYVPAGKAFVRQMIALKSTVELPHHHIWLSKDFLSDLTWWWSVFASHWNDIGLISGSHDNEVSLASDTSGSWGCGAWCGTEWFQLQWKGESQNFKIAIKEPIPILIASFLWGHKWGESTTC